MSLRWLDNIYDPSARDADLYVAVGLHERREDAVRRHRDWLRGKVLGAPRATEAYTEQQLREMKMVGVYLEE